MVKQVIAVVIFSCFVVIGASVGMIAFSSFGVSLREAIILGLATLAALFTLQIFLMLNRRLADLEDTIAGTDGRLSALEEQLPALSSHIDASDEGIRNQLQHRTTETKTDIAALTGIARKLAERTARLESQAQARQINPAQLAPQTSPRPAATPEQAEALLSKMAEAAAFNKPVSAPKSVSARSPAKPSETAQKQTAKRLISRSDEYRLRRNATDPQDREYMQALMRNALRENEIEVHLQPVMTVPQRRPHSYEALARFREASGSLVNASECLPFASEAGLLADIDVKMLVRVIAIAERLDERKSNTPIFCNISPDILNDAKLFPQYFNLLDSHKLLTGSVVFEINQAQLKDFGPLELESLKAISQLGFKFCLDLATDRAMRPQMLASQGFNYVKMPVDILTAEDEIEGMDIHPADLCDYLSRHGLQVIATDIEAENQLVNAMDYGIRYGQGYLFAHPKAVRADLLQASPGVNNPPLRAIR